MDEWDAGLFEEHRRHLRAVAYRMLGSTSEADDAVQEAWLRVSRADAGEVENLAAWLTTVVARVCLNMLRSRTSRREEPFDQGDRERAVRDEGADPAGEALLADSVGVALLVVLDTLSPAERLAFVLHDMFGVPFEEIAPIVDRSPAAARKLASRARGRVRGASVPPDPGLARRRKVVDAFLAASREGDFTALLALLDPDVVLSADRTAVAFGAAAEVRGAGAVAGTFAGKARSARPALVDGTAGAVWTVDGEPRVAFTFTFAGERIAAIDLLADEATLARLDLRF